MNIVQKIRTWFLKPYPYIFSTLNNLKISFGFGLNVFLFLYLFQPFGISSLFEKNDFSNSIFQYTLGFGLITLVVLLVSLFIFPLILASFFNPSKWTIGRIILFLLVTIIMISLFNWYFNLWYINLRLHTSSEIRIKELAYFLIYTILVAIFPSFIFVYFVEKSNNKTNKEIADTILKNKENSNNTITNKQISIIADNKKDKITTSIQDLIYISSQGNYASIFYLSDGKIKEHLIRTSLSKIENQLVENKQIIRCHKSYIVNANQVLKINGNARGYLLKVKQVEFLIPVSRNFPKELLYTLVN